MSELELDALIAQVSADIEREKEFLTQSGLRVGLDESLLRDLRRLNAMRDPIAKLPVEISTEIFLQCVDRYPVELEWRSAPMLLLNVCHARTDIATSIPRLWAELDIHLPRSRPERFPELLQRWLQWASNRPLKISLQGYVESRVISVLWLHSQRLTSLRIHFTKVTVDDYYEDGHYNVLGGMIPQEPLLCLRELSFVGRSSIEMSWRSIFPLLRLCPNLVDLKFKGLPGIRNLDVPTEPVLLPNLRRLSCLGGSLSSHLHLHSIAAPRLDNLTLRSSESGCDQKILSFLRRSSPPVRVLELEYPNLVDIGGFAEIFALLPTMDYLNLRNWRVDNVALFLHVLTQPAESLVLPNLQTLELTYDRTFNHPFGPQWNTLANSLSTCPSRLKTIRLTAARGLIGASENTLAVFREFVAGGSMDVRIVDGDGKDLLCSAS